MRSIEAGLSFPSGEFPSHEVTTKVQGRTLGGFEPGRSRGPIARPIPLAPGRRSGRKILLSYWRDLLPLEYNVLHSRKQELAHWPVPFSCPPTGPTTRAGPI